MKQKKFRYFLLHRLLPSLIVAIIAIVLVEIGFNTIFKPTTYAVSIQSSDLGYPWPTDIQAPCEFGKAGGTSCVNPADANDRYDWGVQNNSTGKFQLYRNGAYEYRNCTDYVAWKIESLGGTVPGNLMAYPIVKTKMSLK